jgi:hypothetical protein
VRPVIKPGQTFKVFADLFGPIGYVKGTPGSGGALQNWQIKGGTGAYIFSIDLNNGAISVADPTKLNLFAKSYTLVLMVSDGILPSHDETVTINMPLTGIGSW